MILVDLIWLCKPTQFEHSQLKLNKADQFDPNSF